MPELSEALAADFTNRTSELAKKIAGLCHEQEVSVVLIATISSMIQVIIATSGSLEEAHQRFDFLMQTGKKGLDADWQRWDELTKAQQSVSVELNS